MSVFFVKLFVRWKIYFSERQIAEYTFNIKLNSLGTVKAVCGSQKMEFGNKVFWRPALLFWLLLKTVSDCDTSVKIHFHETAEVWAVLKKNIMKERTSSFELCDVNILWCLNMWWLSSLCLSPLGWGRGKLRSSSPFKWEWTNYYRWGKKISYWRIKASGNDFSKVLKIRTR